MGRPPWRTVRASHGGQVGPFPAPFPPLLGLLECSGSPAGGKSFRQVFAFPQTSVFLPAGWVWTRGCHGPRVCFCPTEAECFVGRALSRGCGYSRGQSHSDHAGDVGRRERFQRGPRGWAPLTTRGRARGTCAEAALLGTTSAAGLSEGPGRAAVSSPQRAAGVKPGARSSGRFCGLS